MDVYIYMSDRKKKKRAEKRREERRKRSEGGRMKLTSSKFTNGEKDPTDGEEDVEEDDGFGSDLDSELEEEEEEEEELNVDTQSTNFSTSSFGDSFSDSSMTSVSSSSFSTPGKSLEKFNEGVQERKKILKNKSKKKSKSSQQGKSNALLASYYGLAGGLDEEREHCMDIDSVHFNAKKYTEEMLSKEGVYNLLKIDDDMVQEIKRLDSDMQSLVYENYSKFISATDTIRKMKTNVDSMKSDMTDLVNSMDNIAGKMNSVNSVLGEKRSKVDKLVAVRNLLKNVEKIFDLPMFLKKTISTGEYARAVLTFQDAKELLEKHNNIPSFIAILKDCTVVVDNLKDELIRRMKIDGSSTSSGSNCSSNNSSSIVEQRTKEGQKQTKLTALTPKQLHEYIEILIELQVPQKKLQTLVCAAIRNRFLSTLHQYQEEEQERQKIRSISISTIDNDRNIGMDETILHSIMSGLKAKVLNECIDILKIYMNAFAFEDDDDDVDLNTTIDLGTGNDDTDSVRNKEGTGSAGREELIRTCKEIFKPYFEFVCYCFRLYLVYYTDQRYATLNRHQQFSSRSRNSSNSNSEDSRSEIGGSSGEEGNGNRNENQEIPVRSQTRPILDLLKAFLFDMKEVHSLLPTAGFLSDTVLLLSDIVNAMIFIEMKGLQGIALKRILQAYSDIPHTVYDYLEEDVTTCNQSNSTSSSSSNQNVILPLSYQDIVPSLVDNIFQDLENSMKYICPYVALVEFLGKAELDIFLEEREKPKSRSKSRHQKHSHHRQESLCSNLNIPPALTDYELFGVYTYCLQFICWCFDVLERIGGVSTRLLEGDIVDLMTDNNENNNNEKAMDKSSSSSSGGKNNKFREGIEGEIEKVGINRSIFPESFFQNPLHFSSLLKDPKYDIFVNNESTNIPVDLCNQPFYHSKQYLLLLVCLSSFLCEKRKSERTRTSKIQSNNNGNENKIFILGKLDDMLSDLYPELDFPPQEETKLSAKLKYKQQQQKREQNNNKNDIKNNIGLHQQQQIQKQLQQSNITIQDMLLYIHSSRNRLLEHFIELIGNEISVCSDRVYKFSLTKEESVDSYINRCSWSKVVLFSLQNLQQEIDAALKLTTKTTTVTTASLTNILWLDSSSGSSNNNNNKNSGERLVSSSSSSAYQRILNTSRSYMSNINFDLQNPMFSSSLHGSRTTTTITTKMNVQSINSSILKYIFQSINQYIRNSPGLSQVDFLQIQLEFCLCRYCIPFLLRGETTAAAEECMMIETLLDEVMRTGGQRCMISPQNVNIDSSRITSLLMEEINSVVRYVNLHSRKIEG